MRIALSPCAQTHPTAELAAKLSTYTCIFLTLITTAATDQQQLALTMMVGLAALTLALQHKNPPATPRPASPHLALQRLTSPPPPHPSRHICGHPCRPRAPSSPR
ncbi:hypothetical protein [Dermatophilus congolensis]|uniref:hypothetical protein n=1 Tax=Dermatophilus congolensis TaxID=1863 RepID=UPI001AAFACDD|nr:hypothetical protein [Dermatophilus congolensis]MBO3142548.1 hypothetical protein [Dermatophilus congolensis]MBO3151537.1 hypothetical protein [Dermatophilus congolensis]MBO3161460.1 hypothetical protein [Dermatophilus congolensis]MBO3162822.1 hypothetical protein [Dermatophilus congolensis]MBO3176376.1 hypothetical protein [Dermatophilus congolensis]